MECVNLRERFGKQFRIVMDEGYYAERGDRARADDPALQIIPGFRGHVYPAGPDRLAAFCRPGTKARELRALPGVEVYTDGSDGVTVLFAPEQIDQVAELLKLRRRRKPLSPEQREQRIRTLAPFRFSAATKTQKNERPCVPTPQVDLFNVLTTPSPPSPSPSTTSFPKATSPSAALQAQTNTAADPPNHKGDPNMPNQHSPEPWKAGKPDDIDGATMYCKGRTESVAAGGRKTERPIPTLPSTGGSV